MPAQFSAVAMILAAGRGERMRPLTDHTPKAMLPVNGQPLIFHHLQKLADAGFKCAVINHAHLGEQIVSAIGNGSRWNLAVRFSAETLALETAGGIRNALPLLRADAFAVINADIYTEYDYSRLAGTIRNMSATTLAHIVLVGNPPHHQDGDFCLEGHLVRHSGARRLTFSGLGAYRSELFDPVAPGTRHALAPLLREQMEFGNVTGEHFQGEWDDVGTPQRLAELEARLAKRINS